MPVALDMLSKLTVDAIMVVISYVGIAAIQKKLEKKDWRAELQADQEHSSVGTILRQGLRVMALPARVLLPLTIVLQAMGHLVDGLDAMYHVVRKERRHFPLNLDRWLHVLCHDLHHVSGVLHKVTLVVALYFGVWVASRLLKAALMLGIESVRRRQGNAKASELREVLVPMQSIANWVLVTAGALGGLEVMGINTKPVLALLGGSSIVVGLASQQLLANCFSGLNLLLFRPIVVGDRIVVYNSGGGAMAQGVVERIEPLRTILRTDT